MIPDKIDAEIAVTREHIAELEGEVAAAHGVLVSLRQHLANLQRLQGPRGRRKVFSEQMNMTPEVRAAKNLAISKKTSSDPLAAACQAKGMSLRGLARELKVSPGSLVAYRSTRAIPGALADKIEAILGFAATKANWPGGIDR